MLGSFQLQPSPEKRYPQVCAQCASQVKDLAVTVTLPRVQQAFTFNPGDRG